VRNVARTADLVTGSSAAAPIASLSAVIAAAAALAESVVRRGRLWATVRSDRVRNVA